MADVVLLFVAAVLVLGGMTVTAVIVRAGRRSRALEERDRPRRLRADLRATDGYISRVNGALSEDDLDSLERQRNGEP
jgi:hypothetical protein